MRYRLILETDAGYSTFEVVATVDCETPQPTLAAQMKTESLRAVTEVINSQTLPEGAPARVTTNANRGRPARSIYILHFADPAFAPSSLRVGEVVNSSMELSLLLRYNYNMVIQAFSHARAKRKKELAALPAGSQDRLLLAAEKLEVTLRGVTFCYTDELAAKCD